MYFFPYAEYMKIFTGFVVIVLFYNIWAINWLIRSSHYQSQVLAATTTSVNLTNYIAQKGNSGTKPTISFHQIFSQQVLAASDSASALSPSQLNSSPPTPSSVIPKSSIINHKSDLTIALLGDSMIDTLGPDLPHLSKILKSRFPNTKFTLLNYGAGATDLESGLTRLTNATSYLGQSRPPLLSVKPDILVVESFAYNHWNDTQADLDRQWLTLAKIIDTVKTNPPAGGQGTKIILSSTFAPYCPTYTDGSANLPPERKSSECATVKKYLENAIKFALSQNLPLADAYHPSLNGTEGNPKYINQGDHLHPSDAGKQLYSEKVAQAIEKIIK